LLLIKVEFIFFVFIYCTEQLNLKNISYWHYFTTKIMPICPIWNFTLYVTQNLHFFENHPHSNIYNNLIFPENSNNMKACSIQRYDKNIITDGSFTTLPECSWCWLEFRWSPSGWQLSIFTSYVATQIYECITIDI
jgi:hypothetical protein